MPVGSLVRAEQSHLATITVMNPLYLRYWVMMIPDEFDSEWRDIKARRDRLRKEEWDLPVTVTLDEDKNRPLNGKIDFAEPKVNKVGNSGMSLRIALPNPDDRMELGRSASIRVPVSDPYRALVLPIDAIRRLQNDTLDYFVYVVNEKDIVEKKPIEVGFWFLDEKIQVVKKGLKAEDRVVLEVNPMGERKTNSNFYSSPWDGFQPGIWVKVKQKKTPTTNGHQ